MSRRRLQIPRSPLDAEALGCKTAVRTHLGSGSRDGCGCLCLVPGCRGRCPGGPDRGASHQTGISRIAIGGGVAANSALRKRVTELGMAAFIPPRSRCTDNGAMIAHADASRCFQDRRIRFRPRPGRPGRRGPDGASRTPPAPAAAWSRPQAIRSAFPCERRSAAAHRRGCWGRTRRPGRRNRSGLGGLTECLLEAGCEVLAVELDRDLADFLRDRLGDRPGFSCSSRMQ